MAIRPQFRVRHVALSGLLIALVSFLLGIYLPVDANVDAQNLPNETDPTIVGGQNADPGEYPWQAMLTDTQFLPFCGGVLLTPRWVVTAGHCVQGINESNRNRFRVILGAYQFDNSTEASRQVFQFKRVVKHPEFIPSTFDNDVALIELDRPALLTRWVQMISTVQSPKDDALWWPGTQSIVTGWGFTSETGGSPLVLQEVSLPIVEQSNCVAIFGSNLTENMFCAGDIGGGKDACRGDSGGPLIVPTQSGMFKLAGVVSWGNGCARPNRFGVYTRIATYDAWIKSYIKDDLLSTPHLIDSTLNDGFENGPVLTWQESSPFALEMIVNYGPVLAASGQYLAWLGGNVKDTDRIWQTVSFPQETPIFLNFQYQIHSAESNCENDKAALVIGKWRYKTYRLCQKNVTKSWQHVAVRLDSLANHKAIIKFVAWNNDKSASSFFVDNIQLSTGGPLSSQATLIEVFESIDSVEGIPEVPLP